MTETLGSRASSAQPGAISTGTTSERAGRQTNGATPREPAGDARSEEGSAKAKRNLREGWRSVRDTTHDIVEAFEENDLLTYASAISFQILTALVPFFLFVLALFGVLHAQGIWNRDFAPRIQADTSTAVFTVISTSVKKVLLSRRWLWLTFGGALALWQTSGAVRAVMGALNNIYCAERDRAFVHRMLVSFALSIGVGAAFVFAAVSLRYAPFFFAASNHGWLVAVIGFLIRWGLAICCLFLATGLLVHFAPATPQPLHWVTAGSLIVIVVWILTSLGFVFYLTSIASYDSVFGSLSVVVAVTAYLYLSAVVFLFGAQVDALIRKEVKGTAAGASHGSQVCDD